MADRYDELATETFDTWAKDNHLSHFHQLVPYGLLIKLYADALRSAADAARREDAAELDRRYAALENNVDEIVESYGHCQCEYSGSGGTVSMCSEHSGMKELRKASASVRARLSAPVTPEADELARVQAERDELRATLQKAQLGWAAIGGECAVMREALKVARHSLTMLHGLTATDKGDICEPSLAFTINEQVALSEIDIALSSTAGASVLRVVEAARNLDDAQTADEMAVMYENWVNPALADLDAK